MDTQSTLPHPPSHLSREQGRVLVVDDEEENRDLLADSLQERGYEVFQADNGELALKQVRENPPDVILLDAMMPRMDGFETCRWLRKEPASAAIPILMITSLTDRDDRLRGIEAGVNDFLSKPIDLQDVLLRVRNAVQIKRLFDQLHESLNRVKELEAIRDNLTTMLLADLSAPVAATLESLNDLKGAAHDKGDSAIGDLAEDAVISLSEVAEKISALRDIKSLRAGEFPLNPVGCDLGALLRSAASEVKPGRVEVETPREPVRVRCDIQITSQVIATLARYSLTANTGKASNPRSVRLILSRRDGAPSIAIVDNGPGLSVNAQGKIFDQYLESDRSVIRLNSALAFCKLAIEAQGGRIGVESQLDCGTKFWFTLPDGEMGSRTSA